MMTAGKNNGAKPFLMTYFNSYIHKISFEFLIVFYLPIARVECFLKYSLKKKFKCKSKTALTPLLHIDPELVTKNGSSKRLRGHPCTSLFLYAFFLFNHTSYIVIAQNVFKVGRGILFFPSLRLKKLEM